MSHDTHHHHKESFITKYIFSQDHKMIARQYLITAIFMGALGIALSALFRLKLGWPDDKFPILESILGSDAAPNGLLDSNWYLGLVTLHGTIMVFFVLTGGLSGTFSNLLIPLQVGARDMASGLLNMISYWLFFLSSVLMAASLFIETGPAMAGWTVYPPLSVLAEFQPGSRLGMTLWLLSMTVFIASSLLGGINYIVTILNLRTKGMSMTRLPLTIWAFFITAILSFSFPVLLSAAVLLLMDRILETSFYMSDIVTSSGALDATGGSPILYEHLFWFLGHPEVYIILLPALGMTSEIIYMFQKTYFWLQSHDWIYASNWFPIFHCLGAPHVFNGNESISWWSIYIYYIINCYSISSKSFQLYYYYLERKCNDDSSNDVLYRGCFNIYLWWCNWYYSCRFRFRHFSTRYLFCSWTFSYCNGDDCNPRDVCRYLPLFSLKIFSKMMNMRMGMAHFWITIVCGYGVFLPMHFLGEGGFKPRRYYENTNFPMFDHFLDLNILISIFASVGVLAQVIFFFNFFYSIFRGPKASQNPWNSNSLEWTTPVEHVHGNWIGEIPTVYRWPYDYSKPGKEKDFVPQNIPLDDNEEEH